MILQYAMRLNEEGTEKAEHIEDGVTSCYHHRKRN